MARTEEEEDKREGRIRRRGEGRGKGRGREEGKAGNLSEQLLKVGSYVRTTMNGLG